MQGGVLTAGVGKNNKGQNFCEMGQKWPSDWRIAVENLFYCDGLRLKIGSIQFFWSIMNGKNLKIKPNNTLHLQQQSKQEKSFIQNIFKINYGNTSRIFYQENSQTADVKINNYLCKQEGQFLNKVTEIIYEDKVIRIQDRFEINVDPEQLKNVTTVTQINKEKLAPKNMEKVRIFSKDLRANEKSCKKDKKNIVKNIIKIFISWLERKSNQNEESSYEESLKAIEQILEYENFNNRLIKIIVTNKKIQKNFVKFLVDDAQNEIKYSRIQDKQSHYQAMQIYLSLLKQSQNSSEQNRNRQDMFLQFGGSEDHNNSSYQQDIRNDSNSSLSNMKQGVKMQKNQQIFEPQNDLEDQDSMKQNQKSDKNTNKYSKQTAEDNVIILPVKQQRKNNEHDGAVSQKINSIQPLTNDSSF